MAEIDNIFEQQLRSAALDFTLSADFTNRVMLQTVYRPVRVKLGGHRFHQIRLAGVSMIIAGFLIMITNVIPLSSNLDYIKTSFRTAVDQAPQAAIPWFNNQYSKVKGE
ncbi:MAG: hypothetical protein ACM3PA_00755, partial [Methanomassiliicoccales archaeon]